MRFLILFAAMILLVGFAFVRTRLKVSKLSRLSWDDLLAKLEPVPVDGIATVARDYLQPTKGQISIQPNQMWALIGGADGLRRMYANAGILIALAGYAQRWNPEESVIVWERMRRDGMALRRATVKLSIGMMLGHKAALGPFRVQEAASAYYLMSQRLLALYESSHAGRYPALAAAL